MKNYINNYLNSKSEKRDISNTGTDYEYNYDGCCIKVFVPDNEATEDTLAQLELVVTESVTNHYHKRRLGA